MQLTSNGRFTGMEIGDNYPRGINLWSITSSDRKINTIYQFKTAHGTSPENPSGITFDKYDEISSDEVTYYKWSNDNNVYTELSAPGFEEMKNSYHVFFVGENPPLDNSLTGGYIGSARNIGFIKVSLDQEGILSEGAIENGKFYGFNGDLTE
jgi:hypothetical protein